MDSDVRDDELVQQLREAAKHVQSADVPKGNAEGQKRRLLPGADDETVEVAEAASVGTAVAEEKRCRRGTSN